MGFYLLSRYWRLLLFRFILYPSLSSMIFSFGPTLDFKLFFFPTYFEPIFSPSRKMWFLQLSCFRGSTVTWVKQVPYHNSGYTDVVSFVPFLHILSSSLSNSTRTSTYQCKIRLTLPFGQLRTVLDWRQDVPGKSFNCNSYTFFFQINLPTTLSGSFSITTKPHPIISTDTLFTFMDSILVVSRL